MKDIRISIRRVDASSKKNDESQLQNECYAFLADLATRIYNSEEKREHSIVEQAGRMQAAFSFVIAATLVLLQVLIPMDVLYKGFLLMSFSSVMLFLLLCLLFATIAQRRVRREQWPSIIKLEKKIVDEYHNFETEAQRNKYIVDTYGAMYNSYESKNNKRVLWIRVSMFMFYFALGLIVFWFIVGLLGVAKII